MSRAHLDPRMSIVLTLICALAACDAAEPRQNTLPPAVSAAGSGAKTDTIPKDARPSPSTPSRLNAPREARTSAYAVTWSVSTEAAAKGSDERARQQAAILGGARRVSSVSVLATPFRLR